MNEKAKHIVERYEWWSHKAYEDYIKAKDELPFKIQASNYSNLVEEAQKVEDLRIEWLNRNEIYAEIAGVLRELGYVE